MYSFTEVGSLNKRFELDFRVRADGQDVRDRPGEAPKPTLVDAFSNADGMEARFAAAGSYSHPVGMCTSIVDWGGHGSMKTHTVPNTTGPTYVYGGAVAKKRASFELVIGASHPSGLQSTGTLKCPEGSESGTYPSAIEVDYRIHNTSNGHGNVLALPLDASFNLPGASREIPVQSGLEAGGRATIRLSWSTITPKPAFDGNLAR
jgi:hypothetical protein